MKSDHKISAVTAMPEGSASTTASTTTPVYSEFELLHLNVSMLSQHNSMLSHQNLQLLVKRNLSSYGSPAGAISITSICWE